MRGGADVAVVIPAWNEVAAIGPVLDEMPAELRANVFVVVGGEHDSTADIARTHGAHVLVPSRRGYGAACWAGVQAARAAGATVVAFLDGDYADPPSALPHLLEPLRSGTADLVLGCRDLSSHPRALPAHARLGNAAVLALIQLLTGACLRDLPSCKAISLNAWQRLEMQEMSYGWTVEMLVKAARAQLRIAQIRIPYRPRLGGRSKVAGDARASVSAAAALLGCTLSYARWQPRCVPTYDPHRR